LFPNANNLDKSLRQAEIIVRVCKSVVRPVEHIVTEVIQLVAEIGGIVGFAQIKLI
jgi:hypothetical protein